jgi:tetratricopeptide (TPR) repeat protein
LDVAVSLSKLGASQVVLRRFDEAYENLRAALRISRTLLGHEHKTVAQMYCHLACLFYEAGESMAAQSSFEDALSIYRIVWRQEDDRDGCMIQLTDTLCNIGSIQNRRMKFAEAIETFSEALELQRGVISLHDIRIISTMDNLGYAFSKNKNYASALSCYQKILRSQLSPQSSFNRDCLETLRKIVLMYEKLKRLTDAFNEVNDAIRLQKSMNPQDNQVIMEMTSILNDIQRKRGTRTK